MMGPMNTASDYRAIIVGAGPAGLFAAIGLAEALGAGSSADYGPADDGLAAAGSAILVLERREKPARKLLLSGSGQCNITHSGPMADFLDRYGGGPKPESAGRFLKPALFGFTNEELLSWFRARGLDFETEDEGKIFPADRRAASVLKVLQDEASRLGIRIETQRRVLGIERSSGAENAYGFERAPGVAGAPGGFLLHAGNPGADPAGQGGLPAPTEYHAPAVLIAAGGASYPKTGSSGDGYALAASLGHHIVPPRPALAPVFVKDFPLGALAGLSFRDAGLTLRRGGPGGQRSLAREGDLLITHEGLSGPLILDASRSIEAGDILEIRFSEAGPDAFRARLDADLKANPRRLVRTILAETGLTKKMAERFCDLAGIAPEETAASLPRARREALCVLACAFPLEVARLGSLDTAMATAGGVALPEVNPRTLESRLAPGLFFAGEVLDIDGDSGGYNLQAAFSTGALAAKGMATFLAR